MIETKLQEAVRNQQAIYTDNPCLHQQLNPSSQIGLPEMRQAEARWQRFAPALARCFPALAETQGIIESPLIAAHTLIDQFKVSTPINQLWIKADSELPIAGSIKARGGFYEVLKFAESIALEHELMTQEDDYGVLCTPAARKVFSQYRILVGSTGNLGFSIGLLARTLGLHAEIHMSADAKLWKKQRLNEVGAVVIEHQGDYCKAVAAAREQASQDPLSYFVDDERSLDLFMGYTTAALRLQQQLQSLGIVVDTDHPLYVYLPCGVGGAPGGITHGLKHVYGDAVHCIFVQPTQAPCFLIRALNVDNPDVSVYDYGLSNKTVADGMAVPMASDLVFNLIAHEIDGYATVTDTDMLAWVKTVYQQLQLRLEPSATSGFAALQQLLTTKMIAHPDSATHVVWTTGGSLMPEAEFQRLLRS